MFPTPPALAKSSIQQSSLHCDHGHVPPDPIRALEGSDLDVIDVAGGVRCG